MRALRIEFHPERVRISPEEILADLRYPASPAPAKDSPKTSQRRRVRR
jgi:hypothetical protein